MHSCDLWLQNSLFGQLIFGQRFPKFLEPICLPPFAGGVLGTSFCLWPEESQLYFGFLFLLVQVFVVSQNEHLGPLRPSLRVSQPHTPALSSFFWVPVGSVAQAYEYLMLSFFLLFG